MVNVDSKNILINDTILKKIFKNKVTGKSFAARICNAIEITMEHDKLSEMWDEAFELEGIIAKPSGTEDRENKIKKIEAQHSELSVLSELEKAYNEKLTEIEKQIERVEIIDKKRAEKEKKYLEKSERN